MATSRRTWPRSRTCHDPAPGQPRHSRIATVLGGLLLLLAGLPTGVRGANIDLGSLDLDDFAPRSVRPGSTNESVVWSLLNIGPSPVGSVRSSLGFWQTTKGDLL